MSCLKATIHLNLSKGNDDFERLFHETKSQCNQFFSLGFNQQLKYQTLEVIRSKGKMNYINSMRFLRGIRFGSLTRSSSSEEILDEFDTFLMITSCVSKTPNDYDEYRSRL